MIGRTSERVGGAIREKLAGISMRVDQLDINEKVKTYGRDSENEGAVGKIECVLVLELKQGGGGQHNPPIFTI